MCLLSDVDTHLPSKSVEPCRVNMQMASAWTHNMTTEPEKKAFSYFGYKIIFFYFYTPTMTMRFTSVV
jgi:hypothetical protein